MSAVRDEFKKLDKKIEELEERLKKAIKFRVEEMAIEFSESTEKWVVTNEAEDEAVFAGTLDEAFDFAEKKPAPEARIVINGKTHLISKRQLVYEEIVELAGLQVCTSPSVVWRYEGLSGILMGGQSVSVREWMRINAVNTGSA